MDNYFLYSFECVKILKQLFASGSVIFVEYSPRLRLGEYSPIIAPRLRRIIVKCSIYSPKSPKVINNNNSTCMIYSWFAINLWGCGRQCQPPTPAVSDNVTI